MNDPSRPFPRIVREIACITHEEWLRLGATGVAALEKRVTEDALSLARTQLGITNPLLTTFWDLHAVPPANYPMYLCGPNAPEIRSPEDVFTKVWHLDNPLAQFTAIVRDADES